MMSGKIVLSCGHEVDSFAHCYDIRIKTTDRCGEKAIAYMTVCGPCEDRYRRIGYVFDTQDLALQWLTKEEW